MKIVTFKQLVTREMPGVVNGLVGYGSNKF